MNILMHLYGDVCSSSRMFYVLFSSRYIVSMAVVCQSDCQLIKVIALVGYQHTTCNVPLSFVSMSLTFCK